MLKGSIGRGFGEGSVGEVSRLHAGASAGKTPRQGNGSGRDHLKLHSLAHLAHGLEGHEDQDCRAGHLHVALLAAWLPHSMTATEESDFLYGSRGLHAEGASTQGRSCTALYHPASEVTQLHSHQSLFVPRKSQAHPT